MAGGPLPDRKTFEEDVAGAKQRLAAMRPGGGYSNVLIGSQRVNYLVELVVAELFGCPPFKRSAKGAVPFYTVYRGSDRLVPSCFGGLNLPSQRKQVPPGVYVRGPKGEWEGFEYRAGQDDAGIVVTAYESGTRSLELVVLGFSGRSTEATGEALLVQPTCFWPPYAARGGKRVGVYVVRLAWAGNGESEDKTDTQVRDVRVIPVNRQVLEASLR
jgi:hypothetical protein